MHLSTFQKGFNVLNSKPYQAQSIWVKFCAPVSRNIREIGNESWADLLNSAGITASGEKRETGKIDPCWNHTGIYWGWGVFKQGCCPWSCELGTIVCGLGWEVMVRSNRLCSGRRLGLLDNVRVQVLLREGQAECYKGAVSVSCSVQRLNGFQASSWGQRSINNTSVFTVSKEILKIWKVIQKAQKHIPWSTWTDLEKTTEGSDEEQSSTQFHNLCNEVSGSQEHSNAYTKVRVVCFILKWDNFKCSYPATDLCCILFKNALARDFSWTHNFKARSYSFLAVVL